MVLKPVTSMANQLGLGNTHKKCSFSIKSRDMTKCHHKSSPKSPSHSFTAIISWCFQLSSHLKPPFFPVFMGSMHHGTTTQPHPPRSAPGPPASDRCPPRLGCSPGPGCCTNPPGRPRPLGRAPWQLLCFWSNSPQNSGKRTKRVDGQQIWSLPRI